MNYQYIKQKGKITLLLKVLSLLLLLPVVKVSYADRGYPGTDQTAVSRTRQYQEFGRYFADAMNKKDLERLAEVFDMNDFAFRTGHLVFKSDRDVNNFVKGVVSKSKKDFLKRIFTDAYRNNAHAVFLRVLMGDRPLVRVDFQNGGHQYLILRIKRLDSGKVVFVDIFRQTTGKNLSASLAEAVQLMLKPSDSFIKRMFGRRDVNPELIASFKKIAMLKKEGKYKEAYKLIESFPEAIKKRRTMMDVAITLSQHVSNSEYRKQLSMLDKYYGDDDSTVFMLIDYYFFNHEYNKIQSGLDRLIVKLGEDGALDALKADAYLKANDFKNATKYSDKAIKVEPDYEGGYWSLITVLNAHNDYSKMIKVFGVIEKQFGYSFTAKSFEHKKFYSKFVNSPEFKAKYLKN